MNGEDAADARGGTDAGGGADRTRVAAYAVTHDEDDRILLCHIAPSVGVGDIWTLPGRRPRVRRAARGRGPARTGRGDRLHRRAGGPRRRHRPPVPRRRRRRSAACDPHPVPRPHRRGRAARRAGRLDRHVPLVRTVGGPQPPTGRARAVRARPSARGRGELTARRAIRCTARSPSGSPLRPTWCSPSRTTSSDGPTCSPTTRGPRRSIGARTEASSPISSPTGR